MSVYPYVWIAWLTQIKKKKRKENRAQMHPIFHTTDKQSEASKRRRH